MAQALSPLFMALVNSKGVRNQDQLHPFLARLEPLGPSPNLELPDCGDRERALKACLHLYHLCIECPVDSKILS